MSSQGETTEQLVIDSWATVKSIPSYENVAGESLFRRIFELNPDATAFFSFAEGHSAGDDEMYNSYLFVKHSTAVITGVSGAIELLEQQDMQTLASTLKDLGARHASYNLDQAHFNLVGEALIFTLGKALSQSFTTELEAAWRRVYSLIAEEMMIGAAEFIGKKAEEEKNAEAADLIAKSFALTEVAAKADPTVAEKNRKLAVQKKVFDAKLDKIAKLEEYDNRVVGEASSLISKSFSRTEAAVNADPVIAERNRQIAEQKELYEKQMASEGGKSSNQLVVESWDSVKAIPNYQNIAGELLFRRIFELSPETATLFHFTQGYNATDDAMYKNEIFVKHSTAVIAVVTAAVGLLQNGNMDALVSVLKDLGARHAKYDLGEEHYSLVGESLLFTLEKVLGIAFTSKVKESWVAVYKTISDQMMLGAEEFAYAKASEETKAEAERNQPSKTIIVETWARVKAVSEYEKKLGGLMFRRIFDLQPDATAFFPFADGYSFDDDEMYESVMFEKHIVAVVSSIDAAIDLFLHDDMKTLIGVLKDLGARHVAFDLQKSHYDLVGEAFLFALRDAVGDSFDTSTKNAWEGIYGIIAETMMQGTIEFSERREEENTTCAADLVSESFFLAESAANADPKIAEENRKIAEQKRAYDSRVAALAERKQKLQAKDTEEYVRATMDAASLITNSFSLTEIAANADPAIAAQNRQLAEERKAFECRQALKSSSDPVPKSGREAESSSTESKNSEVSQIRNSVSSGGTRFGLFKATTLLLLAGLGGFLVGLSNQRVEIPAYQTYGSLNERALGKKMDSLETELNVLETEYKKMAEAFDLKILELERKVNGDHMRISETKSDKSDGNPKVGLLRKITRRMKG